MRTSVKKLPTRCEELTEFTNGFDPEQGPEVFSISANTSRNGPTSQHRSHSAPIKSWGHRSPANLFMQNYRALINDLGIGTWCIVS